MICPRTLTALVLVYAVADAAAVAAHDRCPDARRRAQPVGLGRTQTRRRPIRFDVFHDDSGRIRATVMHARTAVGLKLSGFGGVLDADGVWCWWRDGVAGGLQLSPRTSGDQMAITPGAVGWQAALRDDQLATDDHPTSTRPDGWEERVQRQLNRMAGSTDVVSHGERTGTRLPRVSQRWFVKSPGTWSRPRRVRSAWYGRAVHRPSGRSTTPGITHGLADKYWDTYNERQL